MSSRVLGCEENVYFERWNSRTHPPILPIRLKLVTLLTNHAVSNRADLRERTKTMSRHGHRRGQIAAFRGSFEMINWLYLHLKYGIKTKTHFEWLLWHWSSLGQLNLEPTRPNCLVGCKVPTDLVKISVKEATHKGFNYITNLIVTSQWLLHVLPRRNNQVAWPQDVHK